MTKSSTKTTHLFTFNSRLAGRNATMKRPYFLALLVVFSGDALLSMLPSVDLQSFNAFAEKPGGGCSGQSCSALPPTSQGCAVHGSGQNVLHNPHCRGTSTSTSETPGGTPSTTATTKETTVTDNHQETTDPGTSGLGRRSGCDHVSAPL